jgi:hypothetical protein
MQNPFTGYLTHLETDYSQFDCLHQVATDQRYQTEMEKLFRASKLFINDTEAFDNSKQQQQNIKVGELCLINETLSDSSPSNNKDLPSSMSILALDEEYENVNNAAETVPITKKNKLMFRGLIIDQLKEKCVVLNVDNGKKLTLKKYRIKPFSHAESCTSSLYDNNKKSYDSIIANSSRRSLEIIPFMLIKARPYNGPITNEYSKQLLKSSRYYFEQILLNLMPINNVNNKIDNVDYTNFIQSEKDLEKLVLSIDVIEDQSMNKLCISAAVADNKRKRSVTADEENSLKGDDLKISNIDLSINQQQQSLKKQQQELVKPSKQSNTLTISKKVDFFVLSHIKSLNLFYLHSSEALKNISYIEEQIEVELLNNRTASKQNKRDIK